MIDQATIERIQSAAQIVDVVSDFVTLRKRGVNYVGLCPFHDDKAPSFYVSPAKNICKCFACGEGGMPVHFVMKLEQLSYTDALKYLAKKYGIEVKEVELTDQQRQAHDARESMFIINSFAQKTFTSNLFDHLEGKTIGLSYFKERGFREDIIRKFQLGYSLEKRDAFTQEALKAGYKKAYLEKTGLTIVGENDYVADRFRGRVMFPVHTLAGKVVAFGGRILKKVENVGKYVNSPESEIYHKGNELYGIYFARQAIVKHDRCFLVEGYTDVISMHQAGIENVVASSGTALTDGQIRLIRRFTSNVTVLYDGDSAGIKAAVRGIDLLLEAGLNIKVVLLPEGEDPDSFAHKQNAASFIEFIQQHETDFVRFKASLLLQEAGNDPLKKAQLITDIVETIAIIPEEIIRSVYVKDCARLLNVDERVLVNAIVKKRQENLSKRKPDLYPEAAGEGLDPNTPSPLADSPQLPAAAPSPDILDSVASPLVRYERDILRYVVRYGERILYQYKDEETQEVTDVSVIEQVIQELACDDLELTHPLYKQVMDEALAARDREGFVAERYFLSHPNLDISRLAVDLVNDKYPLSKVHSKFAELSEESDLLIELVPYALLNYKDAILKKQMDDLQTQIKRAQETNQPELMMDCLQQLTQLQEYRKTFAKNLGERIITKM